MQKKNQIKCLALFIWAVLLSDDVYVYYNPKALTVTLRRHGKSCTNVSDIQDEKLEVIGGGGGGGTGDLQLILGVCEVPDYRRSHHANEHHFNHKHLPAYLQGCLSQIKRLIVSETESYVRN